MTPKPFDPGSKSRLTRHDLGRFEGESLFDRIGRTVCEVERLPRKELYEAWAVAKRVRRRFRGGRVLDMAAGHGLLAWILVLMDNSSAEAVCVDPHQPPSADLLAAAFEARWPHLQGRVEYRQAKLSDVVVDGADLVACVHGCGSLTDQVLQLAVAASARVAVLPCCHDLVDSPTGGFETWMPGSVAVDVERVHWLRAQGYAVRLGTIPAEVTPQNRLILARPA